MHFVIKCDETSGMWHMKIKPCIDNAKILASFNLFSLKALNISTFCCSDLLLIDQGMSLLEGFIDMSPESNLSCYVNLSKICGCDRQTWGLNFWRMQPVTVPRSSIWCSHEEEKATTSSL